MTGSRLNLNSSNNNKKKKIHDLPDTWAANKDKVCDQECDTENIKQKQIIIIEKKKQDIISTVTESAWK